MARAFDAYIISRSVQRLPKLARAFNAYIIGTSIWRLPNWHEHSTITLVFVCVCLCVCVCALNLLVEVHKESLCREMGPICRVPASYTELLNLQLIKSKVPAKRDEAQILGAKVPLELHFCMLVSIVNIWN